MIAKDRLFGSALRTSVLEAVALLEETFPTELARLLDAPRISIQRIVDALEADNIFATRKLGHERRVTLNPRYYAYTELKTLLTKAGGQNAALITALASRRARPRRRGKEL